MKNTLKDFDWDMDGHSPQFLYSGENKIIQWEAENFFQLTPAPPERDDFIQLAQQTHQMKYVMFYLDRYESRINARVRRFTAKDDDCSPEQFLDMKLACRDAILDHFTEYDPNRGADFQTFIYPSMTDALLQYRMQEECWSISSLYEYKRLRIAAAIYHEKKDDATAAVEEFRQKTGCSLSTAEEYIKQARQLRNRRLPIVDKEAEIEETDEEMYPPCHWNYAKELWDGMQAKEMERAFSRLSHREQTYLERRNAICMNCGWVSPMKTQTSFEKLAVMYEATSASGAERAYHKAVEKLMLQLVKQGALHCVRLRQESITSEGKKITVAVYAYQVDNDGAWGTIQFDLEAGKAEVIDFAESDPADTWAITDTAIDFVLKTDNKKLPKQALIPVDEPWRGD